MLVEVLPECGMLVEVLVDVELDWLVELLAAAPPIVPWPLLELPIVPLPLPDMPLSSNLVMDRRARSAKAFFEFVEIIAYLSEVYVLLVRFADAAWMK